MERSDSKEPSAEAIADIATFLSNAEGLEISAVRYACALGDRSKPKQACKHCGGDAGYTPTCEIMLLPWFHACQKMVACALLVGLICRSGNQGWLA